MSRSTENIGYRLLHWVEVAGLVIIAIATVVAMGAELVVMLKSSGVRLADLLLLFIYLEVLAMVGVYLKSGSLPVRMPLYIAIVALARYVVLDVMSMDNWRMPAVSGAILLMSAAVLLIRYGHVRFPYEKKGTSDGDLL